MVAPGYYLNPAAFGPSGDGSGRDRANAAVLTSARVLAQMRAWFSNPPPSSQWEPGPDHWVPSGGTLDGGEPTASNPPVRTGWIQGEPVMSAAPARTVIVGRIYLCSGRGVFDWRGSAIASTADASGPAGGKGTVGDPLRKIWIGSDDGAGGPFPDNAGPMWSNTLPVTTRSGTLADRENPANYTGTSNNWSGATHLGTHTVTLKRASKAGVTIRGARAADPRTAAQRKTQQLCVENNRMLYDPLDRTRPNPIYLQADGKTPYIAHKGWRFDMPTRKLIEGVRETDPDSENFGEWKFSFGNYFWEGGASRLIFQGIRFENFRATVNNSNDREHNMVQFRDCTFDNAQYFNLRGANASYYDFISCDVAAWSQKFFVVEHKNFFWHWRWVHASGDFVVGDNIKCLWNSVQPWDAGFCLAEDCYVDCCWDALYGKADSSGNYPTHKYFQGEGGDIETKNWAFHRVQFVLMGDAALDAKARSELAGIPSISLVDCYGAECRRTWRLWGPAADGLDGGRERFSHSLLLDTVSVDPRQWHVYCPTHGGTEPWRHHRIIIWDNTESGWFFFDRQKTTHRTEALRESDSAFSDPADGNLTVVLHNLADRRAADSRALADMFNSITGLPTAPPWRKQLRTLLGRRVRDVLLDVGGALHDPDQHVLPVGLSTITSPGSAPKVWSKTPAATGTLTVATDANSATYDRPA